MHAHPHEPPVECRLTEAEKIAFAYYRAARGDVWAGLVRAVEDALADLAEAERRTMQRDRLISHGYVHGAVPVARASTAS